MASPWTLFQLPWGHFPRVGGVQLRGSQRNRLSAVAEAQFIEPAFYTVAPYDLRRGCPVRTLKKLRIDLGIFSIDNDRILTVIKIRLRYLGICRDQFFSRTQHLERTHGVAGLNVALNIDHRSRSRDQLHHRALAKRLVNKFVSF